MATNFSCTASALTRLLALRFARDSPEISGSATGRDRSGQDELKRCTAPRSASGPQAAAMRLDDRTADGQPHTSPIIFGRKECIEDLFRLLRGKSRTGITDGDQ